VQQTPPVGEREFRFARRLSHISATRLQGAFRRDRFVSEPCRRPLEIPTHLSRRPCAARRGGTDATSSAKSRSERGVRLDACSSSGMVVRGAIAGALASRRKEQRVGLLALLALALAAPADGDSLCHRCAWGSLRLAGLHEPSSDGGPHARYELLLGCLRAMARGYPLCAAASEDSRAQTARSVAPPFRRYQS
jgi:hypothetical protein